MTAEIAIINRAGIALAADSAITIGNEKVWKSSNKLFHLSDCCDVAVMIYGNGMHLGFPWETLIKEFRKTLAGKVFDELQVYIDHFLNFLDNLQAVKAEHKFANSLVSYDRLLRELLDVSKKSKSKLASRRAIASELDKLEDVLLDQEFVGVDMSEAEFLKIHKKNIEELCGDSLKFHLPKKLLNKILKVCYEMTVRAIPSGLQTGVIFAGYGEKQLLPELIELIVDGSLGEKTRAWTRMKENISDGNSNGTIIPFAQSDIASLFVEGIAPDFVSYFMEVIEGALDQKTKDLIDAYVPDGNKLVERHLQEKRNSEILNAIVEKFSENRHESFVRLMMKVVSWLPMDEMAALAEALVETTSLRRKMDSRIETVGGPVDVAIISKADGFVWIKRKHYFTLDLNPDFVQRRERRFGGASQ